MNRNKRIVLSFVCTLALALITMVYLQAQQPAPAQQDQIDRNSVNQQSTPDVNQDSNLNQEKSTTPETSKQDKTTREKPSSTEQNTQSQDQNQYQTDTNKQTTRRSKTTESESKSTTQRDQSDQSSTSREGLPSTAGELPLIALIGLLSLATAFGTRAFSRVKTR
ncbi:MAG TPA: hypothetical protein VFU37_03395 [Pyrinomonadaceae bacterium]|nr:hypothetical protein [Pyrinomonadaceae bacterium]